MQKMLSIADVSHVLGIHKKTVRGYLRSGQLTGSFIARKWRIEESAVTDFARSLRRAGK